MIFAAAYTPVSELRQAVQEYASSVQILSRDDLVANRRIHIVTSVAALRRHKTDLNRQRSTIIVTDSIGALYAIDNPVFLDAKVNDFDWNPQRLKLEKITKRLDQRTRNDIKFVPKSTPDPAAILLDIIKVNGILDKVQTWIHKIGNKGDRNLAQKDAMRVLLGKMKTETFAEKYRPKKQSKTSIAFDALIVAFQSDYGKRVMQALASLKNDFSEVNILRAKTTFAVDAFELRYITKSYSARGRS